MVGQDLTIVISEMGLWRGKPQGGLAILMSRSLLSDWQVQRELTSNVRCAPMSVIQVWTTLVRKRTSGTAGSEPW